MTEMMARSVVDLTIQMLGGERRLNPDNRHQGKKPNATLYKQITTAKKCVLLQCRRLSPFAGQAKQGLTA